MDVWEVPNSSCPGLDSGPLMDALGVSDLSAFRTSACARSRGSGSAHSRATGISGLISGPCAAAPGERSGRRSSVGDLLAKPPSCHTGNASTVVPRDHGLGRPPLTGGAALVHPSRISARSTFSGAERIPPTLAPGILRFGYQP